ncbi:hypothetical protein BS50DRAFT_103151 [Corynespora cassiicola Philippines]|uniref:Uncharacterized protein n=1 Tax=Corynespora cassiicola Philippines TaxID=1448308 RepID=A0A2T2NDA7_CORCC|nr:hypothetical protein BS50DRAFT_103151 [Corynespora cassiicola Philippines]
MSRLKSTHILDVSGFQTFYQRMASVLIQGRLLDSTTLREKSLQEIPPYSLYSRPQAITELNSTYGHLDNPETLPPHLPCPITHHLPAPTPSGSPAPPLRASNPSSPTGSNTPPLNTTLQHEILATLRQEPQNPCFYWLVSSEVALVQRLVTDSTAALDLQARRTGTELPRALRVLRLLSR